MAEPFLRQIRHLLPRSDAWRTSIGRDLTKVLDGISESWNAARTYVDNVYFDQFPTTTRFIRDWEKEFGLPPATLESDARLNVAAAHQATGGQSPSYIQTVLQAAGFNVWVHEPWETTNPFVARDPRIYAVSALQGAVQFAEPGADQQFFTERINPDTGEFNAQPLFDGFAVGANYWDNKTLLPRYIPPIPEDPAFWPFFLYIAGATFPNPAVVPAERMSELERLICQLRPLHYWVILLSTPTELSDLFMFDAGDGFDQSVWA